MNIEEKLKLVQFGRLQYSSSWDRGLDNVLVILPWLLDRCPELQLHIYYGVSGWIKAAQSRGDKASLDLIESLQKQIQALGKHVVVHDRVNQKELSAEWKRTWLWFYPTNFTETFCITAKEAQASFTPILCSDIGALNTTVGDFGIRVTEHPYSREARLQYIEQIVKLYNNQEYWLECSMRSGLGYHGFDWKSTWDNYWSKFI